MVGLVVSVFAIKFLTSASLRFRASEVPDFAVAFVGSVVTGTAVGLGAFD